MKSELYRGVLIYGRTKKRDAAGRKRPSARPPDKWIRVEQPVLRIIDEALWQAAQERREAAKAVYLRNTNGKLWGKPTNGVESKYVPLSISSTPG